MDIPIHGSYNGLLLDPRWKQKRAKILERDNYQCQNCGCKDDLNVHHKQYHLFKPLNKFFPPWEYEDKYLITLCKNCHQKGHRLWKIPTKIIENMKFFKGFRRQTAEQPEVETPEVKSIPELKQELFVSDENPEQNEAVSLVSAQKDSAPTEIQKESYSLKQIEHIYAFLQQDFSKKGYDDALVNHDSSFRDMNKNQIKGNLILLIKEVLLNYETKILELKHKIQIAQDAGLIDTSSQLIKDMKISTTHQEEIIKMENDLNNDAPHMTQILLSYDLGFNRAIAAILGQSSNKINSY